MMSKLFSKSFYEYETIPLLLYINIAQTGHFHRLVLKGYPTKEEIVAKWEDIFSKNAEATGSLSLDKYKRIVRVYGKLIGEYELVRLHLMKLVLVVDNDSIAYLRQLGYKIDDTSYSSYVESIDNALHRSTSIINKIVAKRKELTGMVEESSKSDASIEDVIASISAVLGFNLDSNITLARFNALRKIAKAKSEIKPRKKGVYDRA